MGTSYENVIYKNILSLCDKESVSFSRMCSELGLSRSLQTKLKENPEKKLNTDTAQKIADYFGVTTDYLLGKEEQKEKPVAVNDEFSGVSYDDVVKAIANADDSTREAILLLLKLK